MNESIAFTGHRPDKLDNDYEMTGNLVFNIKLALLDIINEEKPREAVVGMAIGIDTIVATLAITMNVPLIACLPFKGQERKWSARDQGIYLVLLQQATEIVICDYKNKIVTYEEFLELETSPYMHWKMDKRNRYMVDRGDKLVGVSDGSASGTESCMLYANRMGKPVTRLSVQNYRV